jgi:hypothetical protein
VLADLRARGGWSGKDLPDDSLDTVKMFYDDGGKAGFTL